MNYNQELLEELKRRVTERSASPEFIHHKWFVAYHLEIVEAIALELCDIYKEANKFKVLTLAWLHDFEKIVDFDNQYNTELLATSELMEQIGFDKEAVEDMRSEINIYNAKEQLKEASIEVQIVSSSDAASHFVGPFGSLYWYENPDVPMEKMLISRQWKIDVDWDKKITLPEVKRAFQERYNFATETTGQLPKKYLV